MPKSADIVLKKCLGLKNNEKLLIVTDSELYDIAKMFFDGAKQITNATGATQMKMQLVLSE